MEENKIFRWVWRINGVLLLLLAVGISIFILVQIISELSRNEGTENIIVNVADDPKGKEKWVLGYPTSILGVDFVMLPLVSENRAVESKELRATNSYNMFSGRQQNPAKNILFINSKLNTSSWLFADINQLITNIEQFPNRYRDKEDQDKTKLIFYNVVTTDTNNDKKLTFDDKSALAISNPNGNNYTVIIKEFDRIIDKVQAGNNNVMIIYQSNGIGYSMLLQIEPQKILSNKELPRVKQS